MNGKTIILTILLSALFLTASATPANTYRLHLDKADRYYEARKTDSALIYYRKVIDSRIPDGDNESVRRQQAGVVKALNRTGIIHMDMGDYNMAYKCLIDALQICETYSIDSEKARLLNNIGNIYYHFKKYNTAKQYYRRAIAYSNDTLRAGYYNNLGQAMSMSGETDSAFHYFEKSLRLCRLSHNDRRFALYNSMASLYRITHSYDSAYHYYQLASVESRRNNRIEHEAQNLSDMGYLFLETGRLDSARVYAGLSDRLAADNSFLKVLAANKLLLSKIEESEGHTAKAFDYYKQYGELQDSVFNTDVFGDINQLQKSYEATKTNMRIEKLVSEKKRRERTMLIALAVAAVMIVVAFYIYRQKRNLTKAYDALVEKNLEIKDYEGKERERKTTPTTKNHDELFDRITALMEDTALFCDPEFSIEKLAIATNSNHTYVSRAIKNATNKSFRAFINGYRVNEAQRIFAESDSARYTIESVALRVGFKSRNTFHDVFKDITGVSPNFYLKSVRERQKQG